MANVEVKTMWLVDAYLNIQEVVALFLKDETGTERIKYSIKEDFDNNNEEWESLEPEYDKLLETEEQAFAYRDKQLSDIRKQIPVVRKFISHMDKILCNEDSKEWNLKRKDYLGIYDETGTYNYYREQAQVNAAALELLTQAFHTGMFNVNGKSIRINNVKEVKYYYCSGKDFYHYHVKISTTDNCEVESWTKSEYIAAIRLFGKSKTTLEPAPYHKFINITEEEYSK